MGNEADKQFHQSHTQTPFADNAPSSKHAGKLLQISLGLGIEDISDTISVDPAIIAQQAKNGLKPRQVDQVLGDAQANRDADQAVFESQIYGSRATKWMPGGKESRIAKHR